MATAEEAWQANAKGLCEGPLCSLVLRVRLGETLELVTSGGTTDAGWNTLAPCEIPLGTITVPGSRRVAKAQRSGDWSGSRLVVTFGDGTQLTVYASQLSPGVLIETSGDRLRLFAGAQPRMVSRTNGKLKIHSTRHRGNAPVPGAITPACVAVPQRDGMQVCSSKERIAVPAADSAWMLVWWGQATHFARSRNPITGVGFHADAYLADCPLLLVLDEPPTSVTAADEGGLDLIFEKAGHRVVLLPISGACPVRAEATAKWAAGLPDDVAGRCRTVAPFARQYPVSARETFDYSASMGYATFRERVTFLAVGEGGRKLAPLPPVVALAHQMKFPMPLILDRALADIGIMTAFGPLMGEPDSDTLTWKVKASWMAGPAGHGFDRREPPPALDAEFRQRVERMLAAGLLAPWTYADNIPINRSRGELYWGEPGERLYLLAQLAPALPKELRAKLLAYMGRLAAAHPPESVALIPADQGARRGGYDIGPCQVSKTIAEERGKRVSLFALYGQERYHALAASKPSPESWEACKRVIADAFQGQAWATLYLLGHPNRFLSWGPKERKAELWTSPHWRGDRPCAVVNANRQCAGAGAAVRLALQMQDQRTAQQAWWLLARAVLLRFVMAKYAAWQYDAGLAEVPQDPEWYWRWMQRFPQSWGGHLETSRWAEPADDVRQVVELAPDGVRLGDWAGTMGNAWTQRCTAQIVAFRYLTPELAEFLRDYLKPECRALVQRIEWNHPIWYASFAEAILGWEHNMNHPSDSYQLFMAHAWILGEKPERLERWIDVPWLGRGDLFHLNKLAVTLRAYRWGRGQQGKEP